MPILRLIQGAAFDPSVIKPMTTAFDAALRDLNITDRTDPKAEMVARKIIECAQKGERNPDRMREIAVTAFAG